MCCAPPQTEAQVADGLAPVVDLFSDQVFPEHLEDRFAIDLEMTLPSQRVYLRSPPMGRHPWLERTGDPRRARQERAGDAVGGDLVIAVLVRPLQLPVVGRGAAEIGRRRSVSIRLRGPEKPIEVKCQAVGQHDQAERVAPTFQRPGDVRPAPRVLLEVGSQRY